MGISRWFGSENRGLSYRGDSAKARTGSPAHGSRSGLRVRERGVEMRPLDPLSSIKVKLGVVIIAAVVVTIATVAVGVRAGLPLIVCGISAGALALGMVQFLA